MKKTLLSMLLMALFLAVIPSNSLAAYIDNQYISSQGACVMDYESGVVLYEHNGYKGFSPASMTKVMSLYCIYREIAKQNISMEDIVPISQNVYSIPVRTNYQCIPIYKSTSYTVDELISAVATYSASNALVALAEYVSGNESEFVILMNRTANELGLDATYYDSCGGAPNSITPVSMAKLAQKIIKDYPDIIERTSKKSIIFNDVKYNSTNKLYFTYEYEGADGLKTGTSSTAGFCFCGTAVKNGRRIITVTMNSSGNSERFTDTIKLLDYGFKCINEGKIYFTDISTFIDGFEIPTFNYQNKIDSTIVIIAEDLVMYGFDTSYDSEKRVFSAVYNPEKAITPIEITAFKNKNMQEVYNVYPKANLKVIISVNGATYQLDEFYNLNGYIAFPMDDLADMFSSYWDGNTKSAYIYTK